MFLITTADERSWEIQGKILFLGEWCKLFEKRAIWSKLDYEVLPYHWDDPQRLHSDHLYLNDLYEKYLVDISKSLNEIHSVHHSVRYWRIIVGLWLLGFIHALYDRYQSIITAGEYGKVKNTFIIESDRTRYVPQDFGVFSKWVTESDGYNFYLYSRIIEQTGRIPFEYLDRSALDTSHIDYVIADPNQTISIKKTIKAFSENTPNFLNKMVIIESNLDFKDITRLQLSLHQLPYLPEPKNQKLKREIDLDLRGRIHFRSPDREFEELLVRMIPEQIPSLYLEGYAEMCKVSLDAYPKYPKAILTGTASNANETFKFWASYHTERNVELLGCQHGGTYGSGLLSVPEDHQMEIYGTFYTWGWNSAKFKNSKPLPAAKLNSYKKSIHPKRDGRILLIEMGYPRYSFIPEMLLTSSSGFLAYLDEQFRFVNALSGQNRNRLLVRLFMHDFQWRQRDRWKCKWPEVECSDGGKSMAHELTESSLAIATYNATTYLETFTANFPTLLFWNREHWKMRPSAKPYFDRLREVGILHYTPEQAANKVNDIVQDPIAWWEQPEIQEAKNQFCHQFARTSDNWLEEWTNELRSHMGHEVDLSI
jgi:putative transferase (TIGR04331 family)